MTIEDQYGRDTEGESRWEAPVAWQSGAAAGFVATLATILVVLPLEPEFFGDTIAGMYGLEGVLVAGLLAHLIHGTLFGVVFAAVLSDPILVGVTNSLQRSVLAGLIFAMVLAVVGTGFILPTWMQFIGLTDLPEIPYLTETLVGWHALYGLVLGAVFPFLIERL